MAGSVSHFDVNTPDNKAAATFYGELFGWHTQELGPEMGNYILVDTHAGAGINGGLSTADVPASMIWIEADDLDVTLAAIEKAGGSTVMKPDVVPGIVALAQFRDPGGNVVGLSKDLSGNANGGVSAGSNPSVGWFELTGPDPQAMFAFYRGVFGWEINESMFGEMVYGEVTPAAGGIGGGISRGKDGSPGTAVWASVDDLEKYLERAESLGAKTIAPPMAVNDTVTIAMFADPQGAMFGLFRRTA